MGWLTGYWRVYNVLVRALGMAALAAGIGFIGWGAVLIPRLGFRVSEGGPPIVLLLAGLLAAGLGATILGTPTYRPDLGDAAWNFDPFGKKSRQSATAGRSWWTGDR
jgi:hypothetical protein